MGDTRFLRDSDDVFLEVFIVMVYETFTSGWTVARSSENQNPPDGEKGRDTTPFLIPDTSLHKKNKKYDTSLHKNNKKYDTRQAFIKKKYSTHASI